MFGLNYDFIDFFLEIFIEVVKKKYVMLNNDCKYVNMIIIKFNKIFRLLIFFNLIMIDIYM